MNSRISILFLILLCAGIAGAGCTSNISPASPTPGTGTGSGTTPGAATSVRTFTTAPTDAIPDYNRVLINVGENQFGKISVIFQGGLGQIHVKRIDVKLTRADGTVQTETLGSNKGDEVVLDGTRGEGALRGPTDRVEVWVTMDNGVTYKTNDDLREYRSR